MRPINLVPQEIKQKFAQRDTGLAPYAVIAALALVVIGVLTYVLTENQVTTRKDRVAELSRQVEQAKRQAQELSSYGKFATMRQARETGLTLVATSRFPWAGVLMDISKALPKDAWLTEMEGKVSKEAETGEDSGAGSDSAKSSGSSDEEEIDVPGPTLKLTGCTYRQKQLARMMTRLRNVNGVAQVLLTESKEKDEAIDISGSTGTGAGSDDCRTRPWIHKFIVTLTFPPGPASMVVTLQKESDALESQSASQGGGSGSKASQGNDGGSSKTAGSQQTTEAGSQ